MIVVALPDRPKLVRCVIEVLVVERSPRERLAQAKSGGPVAQ